ncbi:hypothetical protein HII31_02112 [Pseudocercospora fuligena]|uniref:Uncharacterized protein n=1 Tax=Pseudocercospora fuligena TaxID=685502 RepID=A0A8H6RSY7_9PEZI|nr:hypothetical protein HII31_02112 [Pseudocercospora fuligena]
MALLKTFRSIAILAALLFAATAWAQDTSSGVVQTGSDPDGTQDNDMGAIAGNTSYWFIGIYSGNVFSPNSCNGDLLALRWGNGSTNCTTLSTEDVGCPDLIEDGIIAGSSCFALYGPQILRYCDMEIWKPQSPEPACSIGNWTTTEFGFEGQSFATNGWNMSTNFRVTCGDPSVGRVGGSASVN